MPRLNNAVPKTGQVNYYGQSKGESPEAALLNEELANDAANNVTAKPDQLARIIAAAADLREASAKVTCLEDELLEAKAVEKRLEEEILPTLMDEAGVKDLSLDTEDRLVRGEDVYASVSQENMPKAVAWLVKNNMAAIVKANILIPLTQGDIKTQQMIAGLLTKAKVKFAINNSIHPQTLKAFARESVAEGRKLPAQIAVHIQPVVHIKAPRKLRSK